MCRQVLLSAHPDFASPSEDSGLSRRVSTCTGDERDTLGNDFKTMVALRDSCATLERKLAERTRQLELANLVKSRFLAAASHDLRQPLHALGLFAAQLHGPMSDDDRARLVGRIDASIAAINELFNALIDIPKVDAGSLTPNLTDFPVMQLLNQIGSTFDRPAREKGLSLRIIPCDAWIRSDVTLLERIIGNLVSNAVRYTSRGGLIVGCRRRNDVLRLEVWDTGAGVPADQRQDIFGEFYRLGEPEHDRRAGLGLGLAMVDRLCRLLDHPLDLTSTVGRGSRFAVRVPIVPARTESNRPPAANSARPDKMDGRLVVLIDDDPLVREGMGGLFRSWGCGVVTSSTDGAVAARVAERRQTPDLIVSDYHLSDGKTGIEAIERLRREFRSDTPAFLISGDTNPEPLREARSGGLQLQYKPVGPMALRAMTSRMLGRAKAA